MRQNLKHKLQFRFVLLSMAALIVLQGAIVFFSAFCNYRDMTKKADLILNSIRENDTSFGGYFSATVHPGKSVIHVDQNSNTAIQRDNAVRLAKTVLAGEKDRGYTEGYRYQLHREGEAIRILFLSRKAALELYRDSTNTMILFSVTGLAVMFAVLILISGGVVDPIVKNHRKQKEFITSVSHELKTPLTVLLADAQLLETEVGENPWIDDIQLQVRNLAQMTESLIVLARAEEVGTSPTRGTFCLSDTAAEMLQSYEGLAQHTNKSLRYAIAPALSYEGDARSIRQLLAILLDNAFKYCPEGGEIVISIQKKMRGIHLCVTNTAENICRDQLDAFSDRFFRGENAASTAGFGLGLSIAQVIVNNHKGTLHITAPDDHHVRISVTLR